MQGSRVLHPLYTCIARMDWKSNSSKNEKPMWHPGNFSNFCISHCTISRFAMLLRWTFMRRPPPPSVPSWGREKKRKEIPLYICPVTIGQLLHSSHRGIVLSLNAPLSISLYRMQNFKMQQQLHCACLSTVSRLARVLACKDSVSFFFKKSSEVSGEQTKWIQFQIVKRNGPCAAQTIDGQEGIHAMSRNSSENRSSKEK